MAPEDAVLEIRDLALNFKTYGGDVQALEGVDLELLRNETLGLVGESGCGKTVTAMSVMRLISTPPAHYLRGRIRFKPSADPATHVDLLEADAEAMSGIRGNQIGMIFQEPMTSLNPVMALGKQLREVLLQHDSVGRPITSIERWLERRGLRVTSRVRERHRLANARSVEILRRIGIADPEEMLGRYPHELSGGMRQRIMIAMALSCKPHLLIADEPTTALDVTIQAQIMDLMKELKREEEASILLITHHLGLVAEMCDRVAVMYAGAVVEKGTTHDIFHEPRHPYTVGLLRAIPKLTGERHDLPVIPGRIPDLIRPPAGCRFHPRCPYAMVECTQARPPLYELGNGHRVACVLYDGQHEVPAALLEARP